MPAPITCHDVARPVRERELLNSIQAHVFTASSSMVWRTLYKNFRSFATCKTAYGPDHVYPYVTLLSDQPCVPAYVHHLSSVRTFQLKNHQMDFHFSY